VTTEGGVLDGDGNRHEVRGRNRSPETAQSEFHLPEGAGQGGAEEPETLVVVHVSVPPPGEEDPLRLEFPEQAAEAKARGAPRPESGVRSVEEGEFGDAEAGCGGGPFFPAKSGGHGGGTTGETRGAVRQPDDTGFRPGRGRGQDRRSEEDRLVVEMGSEDQRAGSRGQGGGPTASGQQHQGTLLIEGVDQETAVLEGVASPGFECRPRGGAEQEPYAAGGQQHQGFAAGTALLAEGGAVDAQAGGGRAVVIGGGALHQQVGQDRDVPLVEEDRKGRGQGGQGLHQLGAGRAGGGIGSQEQIPVGGPGLGGGALGREQAQGGGDRGSGVGTQPARASSGETGRRARLDEEVVGTTEGTGKGEGHGSPRGTTGLTPCNRGPAWFPSVVHHRRSPCPRNGAVPGGRGLRAPARAGRRGRTVPGCPP